VHCVGTMRSANASKTRWQLRARQVTNYSRIGAATLAALLAAAR
jgi:hypothetical protein